MNNFLLHRLRFGKLYILVLGNPSFHAMNLSAIVCIQVMRQNQSILLLYLQLIKIPA